MTYERLQRTLNISIAAVWIANGLFCKMLNLVPRHRAIVARILGIRYAAPLTLVIGFAELLMGVWILSHIKKRLNAILQIITSALMNVIECVFAPDLLLWGRVNALFAFLFILVVYFNGFWVREKLIQIH